MKTQYKKLKYADSLPIVVQILVLFLFIVETPQILLRKFSNMHIWDASITESIPELFKKVPCLILRVVKMKF